MSDALLKEISAKLSDIHAALAAGGKPATATATATTGDDAAAKKAAADKAAAAKKAAADKAAADKKAAAAAADKAAASTTADKSKAGSGVPAGTKAPGGKHTVEEVRAILRDVATNPALGRTAALAILDENGGVDHLTKLKPENYDAVFEAAQVELNQQKAPESGADSDDELGL